MQGFKIQNDYPELTPLGDGWLNSSSIVVAPE